MKLAFTILFAILVNLTFAQYNIHWELSYNPGISQFYIQQSTNSQNWTSISTVNSTSELIYNDTLNLSENNYYRVMAKVGGLTFYSDPVLLANVLPVIITDAKFTHIKVLKK